MGTCIEAVATSHPRNRWFGRGALHLSDVAARECLARGHHHASELDLIVNVGLYKDHALAEPALASIIQEDIGANPGHPPRAGHHGTFSFDVLDGGCGVVTAAYLLDGFVGGSAAHLGMIVAGDDNPSLGVSRDFPFSPAGGAMLLSHSDDELGFRRFLFRSFPDDAGLFTVEMRWDPSAGLLRRGRNVIDVHEEPAFAARCVEHGIEVAREILDLEGLTVADIGLLITSQFPQSFGPRIAQKLGLDADRVPRVSRALSHAHTAGPIAAFEAATARPGYTLFLTAGAGITIGAALYVGAS